MNRKIAMIVIPVGVSISVICFVLFGLNSFFFDPQKSEVSNLKLTYGYMPWGSSQVIVNFTVRNLYSSYMTTVGVTIDGVDYSFSPLQVNPGEAQEASIPVNSLTLSSSKTYDVKLTFTFADGQYQVYLESCAVKGQATVTSMSLIVYFAFSANMGHFDLIIKNTGNLPITEAKCMLNGFQPLISSNYMLPGQSLEFIDNPQLNSFVGTSYTVTIQTRYSDGSTSTIDTSVVAS